MRRNSAGDEISSILEHDLLPSADDLERGMAELSMGGARPGCFDPYGKNGADEAEGEGEELDRTSTTVASSSLNTTVVTRLEVSDRWSDSVYS